jgi:hypothetical protein
MDERGRAAGKPGRRRMESEAAALTTRLWRR